MTSDSDIVNSFSTLFLFSTAMATGVSGILPLVPVERIGQRFFVLMSLIALIFLGVATVSRGIEIGHLYVACAGFLIIYNICLPLQAVDSGRETPRKTASSRLGTVFSLVLLLGAIACGLSGLVVDAFELTRVARIEGVPAAVLAATFLSSALLLGSALGAMVLGHWYLVARGLSFTPLRRLTLVLALALILRSSLCLVTVSLQEDLWGGMMETMGFSSFMVSDGVFVLARVLFGFLVPLILVKMIWDCLKIESNQSATGILYVVVAFVLIGELLAKHYLVAPGLLI